MASQPKPLSPAEAEAKAQDDADYNGELEEPDTKAEEVQEVVEPQPDEITEADNPEETPEEVDEEASWKTKAQELQASYDALAAELEAEKSERRKLSQTLKAPKQPLEEVPPPKPSGHRRIPKPRNLSLFRRT